MQIIGISGSNGSGKDTIGHMLAERHGWFFVSGSDLLRAEAVRRGLPVERETLRTISAELRREGGLGVLIDKAVQQFEAAGDMYRGLAIASLRNPGEADRVHELHGKVIWVDADPKVRYERIHARQRTAEDNKTFAQFLAEEEAEMHRSGDAATLDMSAVKERADLVIHNDGHDLGAFKDAAEQVLAQLTQL